MDDVFAMYSILGPYPASEHYAYRHVKLFDKITRKCNTISYARYVMCKHLNRLLQSTEHVHHKDGNKHNDSLDNLEVVNASDHIRAHKTSGKYSGGEMLCPNCNLMFKYTALQARRWAWNETRSNNSNRHYCSHACRNTFNKLLRQQLAKAD